MNKDVLVREKEEGGISHGGRKSEEEVKLNRSYRVQGYFGRGGKPGTLHSGCSTCYEGQGRSCWNDEVPVPSRRSRSLQRRPEGRCLGLALARCGCGCRRANLSGGRRSVVLSLQLDVLCL